jgi:hypothetical protein
MKKEDSVEVGTDYEHQRAKEQLKKKSAATALNTVLASAHIQMT